MSDDDDPPGSPPEPGEHKSGGSGPWAEHKSGGSGPWNVSFVLPVPPEVRRAAGHRKRKDIARVELVYARSLAELLQQSYADLLGVLDRED